MRRFVGIDLGREPVPDETTVCRFRHMLEEHDLGQPLFDEVQRHLAAKGLKVATGTIVDVTIINAPSSTKNAEKARDPEMHQTEKGNQWYFGMKAHFGVDSRTKLIRAVVATPANVADSTVLPELLHGQETRVWGDQAYRGQRAVIRQHAPKARDFVNRRYRHRGVVHDVADRGMISAQSIAALEERKLEYVLGVRERSSAEVRSTVIDDQTPFVPLVVPRVSGELTELEAKQVKIGNRRYIVCRNLAEARRDAEQRSAILDGLRAKLAQGDKALVGNSGFRRYLKTVSAEHFAVDETRVAEDARFDGLYVLRTNTKLTPLQVMLRYRDLLRVEQLFRQAKAVLATRPIYHSSDMAIRGHVFCSFLALLLAKELEDRLHRHNIAAEWDDILRDLDRLQEIELEQDGKRFLLRTPTTGVAGKLFQAVGVALPPNLQELPLTTPQPAA